MKTIISFYQKSTFIVKIKRQLLYFDALEPVGWEEVDL